MANGNNGRSTAAKAQKMRLLAATEHELERRQLNNEDVAMGRPKSHPALSELGRAELEQILATGEMPQSAIERRQKAGQRR